MLLQPFVKDNSSRQNAALADADELPRLDESLRIFASRCAHLLSNIFCVPVSALNASAMNNCIVNGTAFLCGNHRATFIANLAEGTAHDDDTFEQVFTAPGAGRTFAAMAVMLSPLLPDARSHIEAIQSLMNSLGMPSVLSDDDIECLVSDSLGNHVYLIDQIVDGWLASFVYTRCRL